MNKTAFISHCPYLSEIEGSEKIIKAVTPEYAKELDEIIKKFDYMPDDEFCGLAEINEIPPIYAVYLELITTEDFLDMFS